MIGPSVTIDDHDDSLEVINSLDEAFSGADGAKVEAPARRTSVSTFVARHLPAAGFG